MMIGLMIGDSLTPPSFLAIFERFARTRLVVCFYAGCVGKCPIRQIGWGGFPRPGEVSRPDRFPESLSSCGGQETLASTARALPTLEGLCGPESTKRNWLLSIRTTDHRRGSRLRVERRQTRSSYLGLLCVFGWLKCHSNPEQPERACAAVERDLKGLKGKELRFANI